MSNTKTLTVAHLLILTTAAQRPDYMVLPLPPTIRVRGGAQRNLLGALLKMELVAEVPVDDATLAWRTDEAGQHHGLRITAAGRTAAGASAEAPAPMVPDVGDEDRADSTGGDSAAIEEPSAERVSQDAPPRRPTGKLGEVMQVISADAGATLAEITTLTGWLPHTARAAVTGLRKRGFDVALIQQNGRKAYRLTMAG